MKTKFAIVLFAAVLCGCGQKKLTLTEQMAPCIQSCLTNDVVGYTRTIKIEMESWAEFPSNTDAIATVEFVNTHGGIERTNLPYRFFVFDVLEEKHLGATLDSQRLWLNSLPEDSYGRRFAEHVTAIKDEERITRAKKQLQDAPR